MRKPERKEVIRYDYARISGADLREALNEARLSPDEFSRLTGAGSPRRVRYWLADREDVPHHAHLLVSLFIELPESMKIAREMADEFAEPIIRKIKGDHGQ